MHSGIHNNGNISLCRRNCSKHARTRLSHAFSTIQDFIVPVVRMDNRATVEPVPVDFEFMGVAINVGQGDGQISSILDAKRG